MNKEFELILYHKDRSKIEYGVYDKQSKGLVGLLIMESPYNEIDGSEELIIN